jgi:spore maturation protein CgeB
MKIVIFGLSFSSSWGNGHATLWRALCGALVRRGHRIVFFERDVPYYSEHRDTTELPGGELVLYESWRDTLPAAQRHLADADVGIVTSYCADGIAASELVLNSSCSLKTFYDLDTPVTLARLEAGESVDYIDPRMGLRGFDLVLSYTGGRALEQLQTRLGARRVAPLYGSVDPATHKPTAVSDAYRCDLSYLGTYSADRQNELEELFIEPARRLPEATFRMGGAQYPDQFPWTANIFFVRHVPPEQHSSFYCSSRLTLNVTRRAMASMGYCPSGRLFEAAACGVPIVSDFWEGLNEFYESGAEILVCRTADDVEEAMRRPDEELARVGRAAREKTLRMHTADHRAAQLESIFDSAYRPIVSSVSEIAQTGVS